MALVLKEYPQMNPEAILVLVCGCVLVCIATAFYCFIMNRLDQLQTTFARVLGDVSYSICSGIEEASTIGPDEVPVIGKFASQDRWLWHQKRNVIGRFLRRDDLNGVVWIEIANDEGDLYEADFYEENLIEVFGPVVLHPDKTAFMPREFAVEQTNVCESYCIARNHLSELLDPYHLAGFCRDFALGTYTADFIKAPRPLMVGDVILYEFKQGDKDLFLLDMVESISPCGSEVVSNGSGRQNQSWNDMVKNMKLLRLKDSSDTEDTVEIRTLFTRPADGPSEMWRARMVQGPFAPTFVGVHLVEEVNTVVHFYKGKKTILIKAYYGDMREAIVDHWATFITEEIPVLDKIREHEQSIGFTQDDIIEVGQKGIVLYRNEQDRLIDAMMDDEDIDDAYLDEDDF